MKLSSSSLVLVAFFAFATTVESFAAIKPVAFRCSQYIPEPDPDDPVYIQNGPYICKISQFDDVDEAVAHNYTDSEIFDSWLMLPAGMYAVIQRLIPVRHILHDPHPGESLPVNERAIRELGYVCHIVHDQAILDGIR